MAAQAIAEADVLRAQLLEELLPAASPSAAPAGLAIDSKAATSAGRSRPVERSTSRPRSRSRTRSPRARASPTTATAAAATSATVPESHTVLVYPSFPVAAPYHNAPLVRPLNFVYTSIFNTMGFPVTQVPTGLNAQRLPTGVQIVGAPLHDHVTIAVAMELERAFGGWVDPFAVASG